MNQFTEAVRAGIQSANEAAVNMAEIREAIAELSQAVREVSEGLVEVKRVQIPASVPGNPFTAVVEALGRVKMVDALNLQRKVAPKSTVELARIDISPSGYPCDVIFGTKKLTCYDKKSLVEVLAEVLASPTAGKALINLMNMKPEIEAP